MTQEQYNRALQIGDRIGELEKVKEEIEDKKKHRLWYAQKYSSGDWVLCSEWLMQYISELLDKHDLMIRAEIEEEIQKLKEEIERL